MLYAGCKLSNIGNTDKGDSIDEAAPAQRSVAQGTGISKLLRQIARQFEVVLRCCEHPYEADTQQIRWEISLTLSDKTLSNEIVQRRH